LRCHFESSLLPLALYGSLIALSFLPFSFRSSDYQFASALVGEQSDLPPAQIDEQPSLAALESKTARPLQPFRLWKFDPSAFEVLASPYSTRQISLALKTWWKGLSRKLPVCTGPSKNDHFFHSR
jgi:hypothetical protein